MNQTLAVPLPYGHCFKPTVTITYDNFRLHVPILVSNEYKHP